MSTPATGAKVYIGLSLAGALGIAATQIPALLSYWQDYHLWQLVTVTTIAAALSLFRVFGSGEFENYDIAWTLYGFALFYLGLPAALVVILVANLTTMAARRYKWPWYVHFFNISSFAIAAGLAAAIYHALTHIAHADSFAVMMSIVTAVAAFTLFNHTHVAGVLWLSERVTPAKSGLFASSSLLVDASLLGVGALCALIAPMNPFAIVLGAAPLYLIHSALRIPRLERKAKTDAKTGLYHSHHFAQRAEQEFERAKRLNRPLSLVMIDLDLLRDVNNTHGHLGGDVAIQTVAKALREHALEDDVVARFGGEEFVGLFVECDLTTAAERAEKIRKAIETAMPVLPNGQTFKVTASLGLAQCDRTDANLAALIGRADEALYAAKHEGRNCLRMHKKHGFAPTTPRLYRADETAALCVIPMRKGEMFK